MLRAKVRGFELPEEVARWLQRRYPRDMGTLYQLLDTLDSAALVAQRRLTLPFIRSVLLRARPVLARSAPRADPAPAQVAAHRRSVRRWPGR